MISLTDRTMAAVEYALGGLATRTEVHAHNVANAATPAFRAQRVEFETALREALNGAAGDARAVETLARVEPSVVPAATLPDAHGNTVSLETEVSELMKADLQRNAMVGAFNFKLGVLRTAITGQSR